MSREELKQVLNRRALILQLMDEARFKDPRGHKLAEEKVKLINQQLQEKHYAEIARKLPPRERLEGKARKQLALW